MAGHRAGDPKHNGKKGNASLMAGYDAGHPSSLSVRMKQVRQVIRNEMKKGNNLS